VLLLLVVAVLSLLIPAVACAPAETGTIKIGCLLDFTGDLAYMADKMADGARLAVEDINAAGGVLGKQVELVEEDGAMDPATGLTRIKKMVEVDGIQVIAGPMITPTCELATKYGKDNKITFVTPSATGAQISQWEGKEWLFRACLSDDLQAKALAPIVMEGNYTKLATIYVNNAYGEGLQGNLIDELQSLGWNGAVVAQIPYEGVAKEYHTELQQIVDKEADVAFAITYCDDGIILFKQALDMGLDNIAWLGCDGNGTSGIFEDSKAAEFMDKAFVAGTRTGSTGTVYEEVSAAYQDKYGELPGIYSCTTYDAVRLAAKGIEAAGVYDGEAIRDAIKGIEFEGASGPIEFNELGDRSSGVFEIWAVEQGEPENALESYKGYSLVLLKYLTV